MSNYYFVIAALPPLEIGLRPELSFKGVREMLALNLSSSDFRQTNYLLGPIDLYNLRAFWLGLPLDDRGNYSDGKQLEEALLVREGLPGYVVDFLDRHESNEERLHNFSALFAEMYRVEPPHWAPFLHTYFSQEREIRLVLLALRAKEMKRDIVRELQFENFDDSLVAHILAQKDALDYVPPAEYEDLKALFIENKSDPHRLERALLKYRFEKIEDGEENHDFTIGRILAYLARLLLVESVSRLDQEWGKKKLEELELL